MDDTKLRRREFLARTAAAAGLAGLSSLPAGTLIAEAARAQATGAAEPAQPAARPRGRGDDGEPVLRPLLRLARRAPTAARTQTYLDAGTGEQVAHAARVLARGAVAGLRPPRSRATAGRRGARSSQGGFLAEGSGNDEFALTYYDEGDVEFLHAAAGAYTVYDRFFCSLLGPTWPNRYYKWSAQSGGRKDNTPPLETAGNQWETIFDRAIGRGVTARYYHSDLPFSAVWGPRGVAWTRPLAEYYADCALGTLPNITFVDPPFRDGGGGDGISADEHPHGDVRLGQAWMADVVRAFIAVALLSPRRAVRRLRRVGRLLRPRAPAARARRPRERRPRRGLRPDGLPHPGRGGLPVRPRRRTCATPSSASSRSSS